MNKSYLGDRGQAVRSGGGQRKELTPEIMQMTRAHPENFLRQPHYS